VFVTVGALSGGPAGASHGLLIAVTIVAGLLLGPRAAVLTGAAGCAAALGFLLLAGTRYAPVRYFPVPPLTAWHSSPALRTSS
jgi:hypothetical protein